MNYKNVFLNAKIRKILDYPSHKEHTHSLNLRITIFKLYYIRLIFECRLRNLHAGANFSPTDSSPSLQPVLDLLDRFYTFPDRRN